MATLSGQTIASTYDRLLAMPAGGLNGATLVAMTDGNASATACISITDNATGKAVLAVDGSHANGTEIQIDNSATTGDSFLSFQLSGTSVFTMGVDDSDSDKLKIGTTAVETNTRLTIDSSGNVGIGTTAPASTLTIVDATANDGTLQIGNHASNFGRLFWDYSESALNLSTHGVGDIFFNVGNNAFAMVVKSGGYVGIGINTPYSLVQMKLNSDPTSFATAANNHLALGGAGTSNGYTTLGFGIAGGTSYYRPAAITYKNTQNGGNQAGELGFWTRNVTTAAVAPTQRMVITDGGDIGIGEATPAADLEIKGNLSSALSDSTSVTSGTGNRDVASDSHGLLVGDAVRLLDNGESAGGAYSIFSVATVTDADNFVLDSDADAAEDKGQAYSDSDLFGVRTGDDGSKFVINNSGYVGIGDSTPSKMLDLKNGASGGDILAYDVYTHDGGVTSSDGRMKENITDSALGLNFVNALKPRSFKWKDTEEYTDNDEQTFEAVTYERTHYGMVSQEVRQAMDDLGMSAKDFAGWGYEEDRDLYFLRYTEFISPLIKAVQELSAKVEALENNNEQGDSSNEQDQEQSAGSGDSGGDASSESSGEDSGGVEGSSSDSSGADESGADSSESGSDSSSDSSVEDSEDAGSSGSDASDDSEGGSGEDDSEGAGEPSEEWTKDQLKAYMDSNEIAYNSGDTKQDLLDKITLAGEGPDEG